MRSVIRGLVALFCLLNLNGCMVTTEELSKRTDFKTYKTSSSPNKIFECINKRIFGIPHFLIKGKFDKKTNTGQFSLGMTKRIMLPANTLWLIEISPKKITLKESSNNAFGNAETEILEILTICGGPSFSQR